VWKYLWLAGSQGFAQRHEGTKKSSSLLAVPSHCGHTIELHQKLITLPLGGSDAVAAGEGAAGEGAAGEGAAGEGAAGEGAHLRRLPPFSH